MTVTLITAPAAEVDDTPTVRTVELTSGRYVQVLGLMDEPVLDLTCTEALNLAMKLIEEAGTGFNARLTELSERHHDRYAGTSKD